MSTVRVMVITRGAFESIERNFPIASRLVLENLKRRSEAQVCSCLPTPPCAVLIADYLLYLTLV